jgi:copper oxidase (laccase) domain-containing protein
VDVCTYASPAHFSHRRDGVTGRQALIVTRER